MGAFRQRQRAMVLEPNRVRLYGDADCYETFNQDLELQGHDHAYATRLEIDWVQLSPHQPLDSPIPRGLRNR
jgi:hypothetical protein